MFSEAALTSPTTFPRAAAGAGPALEDDAIRWRRKGKLGAIVATYRRNVFAVLLFLLLLLLPHLLLLLQLLMFLLCSAVAFAVSAVCVGHALARKPLQKVNLFSHFDPPILLPLESVLPDSFTDEAKDTGVDGKVVV
jgi:hypothetical protein